MQIGLKTGDRGPLVARLHAALAKAGRFIDDAEREAEHFGESTLQALRALQAQHRLAETGEMDEDTLRVLVDIDERVTINIYEGGPPAPPPPSPAPGPGPDRTGRVHGQLVDGDGAPIADTPLALFAQRVRGQTRLADTCTDAHGRYAMEYHRPAPLTLQVLAYGPEVPPTGKAAVEPAVIARSATVYAAPPEVQIDLTTAADGIVRQPSIYSALLAAVDPQLHGATLESLQENATTHEISFVAGAAGEKFADVARLVIARRIALAQTLHDQTLFGLFAGNVPASLGAALGNLPTNGIDDAFVGQVFAGVLAQTRATLQTVLDAAVAGNTLPASYAGLAAAELDRLDALRQHAVGQTPYIRGKTPLSGLLAAGNVEPAVGAAFTQAYATSAGRLGPTWKALRADKSLTSAQLAALNTTLSVGELVGGNLPLLKDTLQRLSAGSLANIAALALLDQADWEARIGQVDPQGQSVPPVLPEDPPAQRIARFAQALAERFARRFPSMAFAGGLTKATASSFGAKDELISVITANPNLSLRRTNIEQYVVKNKVAVSAAAVTQLKTAQRLYRLSPHYTSVEALNSAGYASAQAVYFKGRQPFVAQMTQPLGSVALAGAAWTRAQAAYASSLAAFGRFNLALNGVSFAVLQSAVPPADAVANLPSLQSLFGSLDACLCTDCRSVTSPAAYLVDLLQFLKQRAASGGFANARDVLLGRRPDLQYIALGCDNTDITLPYIDLVNELFESVVAPPATPVTLITTTGTSDERRALPQQVDPAAYAKTAAAVFPLTLPFDLGFAQTEAFLTPLGLPLAQVMQLCTASPGAAALAAQAGARLALAPAMQAVIAGRDAHQPWERWGFASANPGPVLDPKLGTSFTPADWVAALQNVPVLLGRSGLTLDPLYQLMEVRWFTQGAVTLNPGMKGEGDSQVVSCDTEAMFFNGLDAAALDRANRFLRLWQSGSLAMWELDWALDLAAGGALDDAFVVFLCDALAVRDALGVSWQELLAFWGALGTRSVTSHLQIPDTLQPSAYDSVFRNPTMTASWGTVFVDAAALPGTPIVVPADPPPTPAQLANLNAIKAALGLSGDDIAAILASTGAANALSLPTLGELLRHARLASALSLPVDDLLLWVTLAAGIGARPFGGAPAETREFLRRLALLQATGLAVHDLDYLLRDGSAAQTALAFTPTQVAAVLQSLRDSIAKLASAAQSDAPTQQALFVAALATATGMAADVVTPALADTGALPLPPATLALLLAQTSGVDPSLFPALADAAVRVGKACALFGALKATTTGFAFLIQRSGAFGWLDPADLPRGAPPPEPYLPFEALVRALALDARQAARSPKLFDVLGAWVAALPPDLTTAISGDGGALAVALNASVTDITALAGTLGATAPSLAPATRAGSLADMGMLAAIAAALDAMARVKIGAATLVQLAASPPTFDSAAAAMGVFQAQYTPAAWFAAVQPVEDTLREKRRDALVAFILGGQPAMPDGTRLLTTDDLFDWYLIDPEMCPCGISTRLLEASLAVQQFVQQCFLGLVREVVVDAGVDSGWNEWNWMKQYRLWQANREVFLYPENYLLPELRTDKSPFFVDLENDLKQSNCDDDAATAAFENYLRKLVDVSRLVIGAHYQDTRADGTRVLHVFARTRSNPPAWYYRIREEGAYGSGLWAPWQSLNLDIHADHVVPVVWDQRLHLLWAEFHSISEPAGSQNVPSGGGGSSRTTRTTWAVEFALSEYSAGHWQARRSVAEKMYFSQVFSTSVIPPRDYTLRAFQDASFNLQIEVYFNSFRLAMGTLSAPDAPMVVVQADLLHPPPDAIDKGQEPSYALAKVVPLASLIQPLAAPQTFTFSAQVLVCGSAGTANPGAVPLYVLANTGTKLPAVNVELLGRIVNPVITYPLQEAAFDSADPFFVTDTARQWFVQPHYYTVSSSPQELDGTAYQPQWNTSFQFAPFYHPFARTFLRELEIGGTDRLMQRTLQLDPLGVRGQGGFDFSNLYLPQPAVAKPYPGETVDFSNSGAYASYNWELFYHAPMFVASQLLRNKQYDDALKWLEYIFDPTDPSPSPVPGHFWRTAPFYAMNASDWLAQQIQNILATLAADQQQGISDPDTAAAIADWLAHPYDPHRVARLRPAAYAKYTVTTFLDVLIAHGDSLFAQYTMENVAQAEQLYVFADLILGPRPELVRLPDADQPRNPDATTYAEIENALDEFSNLLVDIENVIAAPSSALQIPDAVSQAPSLPKVVTSAGQVLFFCIPPNDQLLAYWDTVADRLYKIRHCLNLQGVAQPLPLYAPPINPLQLIEAAAGGATNFGAAAFTPIYRFQTYLDRAIELTEDVRAFGALVLAALEKKDAETLAALRANQDLDIQGRILDLKTLALTEATDQVAVLQRQHDTTQIRANYYASIAFINDWEIAALAMQAAALILNGVAVVLDMTSGVANALPSFDFGAAGFGGSPMVVTEYGGQQVGAAASSFASVSRGLAGILGEGGAMASTMGSYQRRMDDWNLQAGLAASELLSINAQITAANDRVASAQSEIKLQQRQIENSQTVRDFLVSKYTNADLYDWTLTQLTAVHTQAYQLAYSLAQQAQAAYQYELGSTDTFVQFGYWDSQHKGLTAGESLLFDLRRMQAQFLAANAREIELVKHVSLALTQPKALVQLLQTGTCSFALDEALFDRDHPGHYFRRLRAMALTVPCVTGPYTGVNATLQLDTATVRIQAPVAPYTPALASAPPASAAFVTSPAPATASIATSHGQNDAGLFELNLHDERWLPFEGQGAISTWTLVLDPRDNAFDLSTVSDVVLHLRYTARAAGGDPEAVRQGIKPQGARQIMLSVRNSFGNAYDLFFNPADPNAAAQSLVLPLLANVFPFSNLGQVSITGVAVFFALAQAPAPGTSIAATFGPTGGAANPVSLVQVPGSTGSGAAIAALGGDAGPGAPSAPQSFTLVVPEAQVPAALGVSVGGHQRLDPTRFDDIVLVLGYKVA